MAKKDKLEINKQSLGRRGTTAIHLGIDTYLKIEKISIMTGRRKTEILAQMVDFALEYAEIEGCEKKDFDFGLNMKSSCNANLGAETAPMRAKETPVFVPIKDAVEITGLSEFYFRKHLETGEIPAIKSGNKWLIHIENLLKMLEGEV